MKTQGGKKTSFFLHQGLKQGLSAIPQLHQLFIQLILARQIIIRSESVY